MGVNTMTGSHKRRNLTMIALVIVGLLLQPIAPIFDARIATADDEFEPWCGNDCDDPDNGDDDNNNGCQGDDSKCDNGCSARGGGAINLFTGEESFSSVDVSLPGFLPLMIVRSYRSQSQLNNRYGFGWDLNINQRLQRQSDGSIVLNNGTCGRYIFKFKDNVYQSPRGVFLKLAEQADGSFLLRDHDGSTQLFDRDGKLVAMRDRFNNQITLAYHPNGKLPIIGVSRFFHSQSRGVIGYDFQLMSVTDSAGRQIAFGYNSDGRLTSLTYGDGTRSIQYDYDANDNLKEVIDELSQRTIYRYEDPQDIHNLTSTINAEGREMVRRVYDGEDRVVRETVDGATSTVGYQVNEEQVVSAVFANGRGDRFAYKFDQQGNTTSIHTELSDGANESKIGSNLAYNSQNQVTSVAISAGTGTAAWHETVTYDTDGYPASQNRGDGLVTEMRIDAAHDYQPVTFTNTAGGIYTLTYDTANHLEQVVTPLNERYKFGWSSQGLPMTITNPLGQSEHFGFDTSGNLTRVIDPAGNAMALGYDALGHLIVLTDALSHTSQLAYDALGQLTMITDALAQTHSFQYDSQGNLTGYVDPNHHAVTLTYSGAGDLIASTDALGVTTTYTYDGGRNLTHKTGGNGTTTVYRPDNLGRLTAIQYAGGSVDTYRYDALSNLVESKTTQVQLGFDYTNGLLGSPSTVTAQGIGQNPVSATLTYDYVIPGVNAHAVRQHSGLIYAMRAQNAGQPSFGVNYDYNANMRLTMLGTTGVATYQYRYGYDAASRLVSAGAVVGSPGVSTTLGYDDAGRINLQTNVSAASGQILSRFVYTNDVTGNLREISEVGSGGVIRYGYDANDQLISATLPDGTEFRYAYDPARNRILAANGSQTLTYGYNQVNQIITSTASGGTTYTYDGNGNLHTRFDAGTTLTYTWNSIDELVRIDFPDNTFVAYDYDGLGRRISRQDRNRVVTYFVYDGYNLVQELNQAGEVEATYVHARAIDSPISMTRGGITYFYVYDQLGSVIGLVNGAGQWAANYTYDPWGNIVSSLESIEQPFRFTGREWDAEAGLYFYRTRYYDPTIGRFIQRDKAGLVGGLNPYTYVANNPVNWVDPFGDARLGRNHIDLSYDPKQPHDFLNRLKDFARQQAAHGGGDAGHRQKMADALKQLKRLKDTVPKKIYRAARRISKGTGIALVVLTVLDAGDALAADAACGTTRNTARLIGRTAGGILGAAAAGAALGSIVPGAGTALGFAVGLIGGIAGSSIGEGLVDLFY